MKDAASCQNVANGIAMDKEFISLPTLARGKKISTEGKWSHITRQTCTFWNGKFSDKMALLNERLDMLSDIGEFWKRSRKDYRVSVQLDEFDFENADFTYKVLSGVGRLIGVDDYLETYNSGVHAEDILA